jgi:RNase P subunit RPR2
VHARVIWACPYCGHKHRWNWARRDAEMAALSPRIGMVCADRRIETGGLLRRDGETRKAGRATGGSR